MAYQVYQEGDSTEREYGVFCINPTNAVLSDYGQVLVRTVFGIRASRMIVYAMGLSNLAHSTALAQDCVFALQSNYN